MANNQEPTHKEIDKLLAENPEYSWKKAQELLREAAFGNDYDKPNWQTWGEYLDCSSC